jgi:hypothetical protein
MRNDIVTLNRVVFQYTSQILSHTGTYTYEMMLGLLKFLG